MTKRFEAETKKKMPKINVELHMRSKHEGCPFSFAKNNVEMGLERTRW